MKLANIKYFCTVNAPGFSTSVFCSGCSRRCPGCFNKIAWDYNYGHELTDELINKIISETEPDYIKSLCILGGEPLDPANSEGIATIIKQFREHFGSKKNIWLWTGYIINDISNFEIQKVDDTEHPENYDEILASSNCKFEIAPDNEFTQYILSEVDYVVDGPFVKQLHSLSLKQRGSSNQRVLKVKK